ncbi:hypothetical protein [Oceanococcus atlanticus]|uniref:hypothetical protein n=1 Tax=Oceanococcus atlanticus TaxID=1317117 RepID=UPI0011BA5C14|nr:hypothetical protein [Oceanococcus atlanticus]
MAYLVLHFWVKPQTPAPTDAVGIANTYIVFTSLIFMGFTVVLALVGVIFAQQFSITKQTHVQHLFNELEGSLELNHDDTAVKLLDGALRNKDVQRHVARKLDEKIRQLLSEEKQRAQAQAADGASTSNAVDSLLSKVDNDGVE